MLIHDFSNRSMMSHLGTEWRAVSDRVMGGVSEPDIALDEIEGRPCLRLTGNVRLENNGGFIQAALDLAPDGGLLDARPYAGVRIRVRGNGERYGVHLRTPDAERPWQSYRAQFVAAPAWSEVELAFGAFEPYRLDAPLDLGRLRRLGIVAIGRAFAADLTVSEIRGVLDTSRKYAVPMCEYLDRIGLTRRENDVRVLNEAAG